METAEELKNTTISLNTPQKSTKLRAYIQC